MGHSRKLFMQIKLCNVSQILRAIDPYFKPNYMWNQFVGEYVEQMDFFSLIAIALLCWVLSVSALS